MTIYTVGDVLTLTSGQMWRISSMRYVPYPGAKSRVAGPGDDPKLVTVGLDDPANPGKHGTAVSLADLMAPGRVREHAPAPHITDIMATDLVNSGWLWGRGAAEVVAARLINLGWRR